MASTYNRRINLYINGKEVKNDIKSIRREMSRLTNEQARMTIGSREYNAHAAKIRSLRGVIRQHNADLKQTRRSWFSLQNAVDGFNKYFGIVTAALASFAAAALTIKSAVDAYAQFDDKMADVMKTTGLTKDQVKELNDELEKIDTRTSMVERMGIARIGGKLGITDMEEIIGFVRASDQIAVALGEDLGGAEGSIQALGKLTDIFDLKTLYGQEQALLKVGSAINELGMATTANEGYLVTFARRTAGIAPQAGVSVQNILGLAATLDALGQGAEMSSTAYSKLMTTMTKKTSEFAAIAGMEINEFSQLLRTDANEAMLLVFEGLNNNQGGFEQLIASLGDLGIEGQRMTAVFGAMANNTEMLREQQELSNKAFADGSSLTTEFNIKNTSVQAGLEKAKEKFAQVQRELGERLAPAYAKVIKKGSLLLKSIGILTEFLFKHGLTIVTVVTTITAYTVATRFAVMWQNRHNTATLASIVAQKLQALAFHAQFAAVSLFNTAVALLRGNLKLAAIQFRAFSAAMAANPIGLVVTLLTTAGVALYSFFKKTKDAAKGQQELNEAMQAGADLQGRKQYEKFLDDMNLYTEKVITMADGSARVVKSFNQYADVVRKFEESLKTLRLGELENFKLFFEEEIINMQRNLETLDPDSLQFEMESAKIQEFTQNLELVNSELEDIARKRKELGSGTNVPVDFDTMKKGLESAFSKEQNLLKQQLLEKKLTQEGFNREMFELELAHLVAMRQLYISHGKDIIDIDGNILDHKLAWQKELDGLLELSTELSENLAENERKLFEDIDGEMEKHVENYKQQLDKETEATIEAELKKADARKKAQKMQIDYAVQAGAAAVENAKTVEEATSAILNSIRKELKAYLAEFIATAALKALRSVPFPINIAAAAAAGGAATFLFNSLIPEFASGKYDVKGQSGNRYNAKWAGRPATGMYGSQPHIGIFNEVPGQPEMVIDGLTTRKLQVNFPQILDAIYAVRDGHIPHFATGKYPVQPQLPAVINSPTVPLVPVEIDKFNAAVEKLLKWEPSLAIELFDRKLKQYNDIKKNSGL